MTIDPFSADQFRAFDKLDFKSDFSWNNQNFDFKSFEPIKIDFATRFDNNLNYRFDPVELPNFSYTSFRVDDLPKLDFQPLNMDFNLPGLSSNGLGQTDSFPQFNAATSDTFSVASLGNVSLALNTVIDETSTAPNPFSTKPGDIAQLGFPITDPVGLPRIPGLQQDGTFGGGPVMDILNGVGNVIGTAMEKLPANTTLIIGTRINALPPDIYNAIPENVRSLIPLNTSASMAIILPKNTKQILDNGGNFLDVMKESTLWLGIVPPSGPWRGAKGNDPIPGAFVLTWNKQGFDFRAGYAGLTKFDPNARPTTNPLNPQNGERFLGIPGLAVDKNDPSNWLFFNSGISWAPGAGGKGVLESFRDGQAQINNAFQLNKDSSGNVKEVAIEFSGDSPNIGAVFTWGDLHRVPGSKTVANRFGDVLTRVAPGTAWFAPLVGGLGIVFKQSTGVYVGVGGTATRLSLGADGEFTFKAPGFTSSANLFDAGAVAGNIARPLFKFFGQEQAGINADLSLNPTRQTLSQIAGTPLEVIGNEKTANSDRLNFYFDEKYENNPDDIIREGASLMKIYWDGNELQKTNAEQLYNERPEFIVFSAVADNLLSANSDKIYQYPVGILSNRGSAGMPEVFQFIKNLETEKRLIGEPYQTRIDNLATALVDAGFPMNFGSKDLAAAIDKVKESRGGNVPLHPRYDELRQHMQK